MANAFDFDFKKLEQDYSWTDETEFSSFSVFPCARFISQDTSGWNNALLTPSQELDPPDSVTMVLNSWGNENVSVNIENYIVL